MKVIRWRDYEQNPRAKEVLGEYELRDKGIMDGEGGERLKRKA